MSMWTVLSLLARGIGIGAVFMAVVGATIPGMNFHVVFGDDEAAQKFHARKAVELEQRIKDKTQ